MFPLIECFILSFPFLLIIFSNIYSYIFELVMLLTGKDANLTIIFHMICIVSVFIFNFIFYSVLKKKYNFEMHVFLYGVGFTLCCVIFAFYALSIQQHFGSYEGSIETSVWSFYILPFIFLYYSYATLLTKNGKDISKVTLFLMTITFISFAILIIFEIIKYQIPFIGIFLLLFGLYLAYCLIYKKKGILNLRLFTWSPFLPSFILFWSVHLYILTLSIIRF